MSLATGRAKLVASLKDLHARWDRIGTRWNDPVSRDFAEEFIAPLENKVRAGTNAMETMFEMLAKARRDCE